MILKHNNIIKLVNYELWLIYANDVIINKTFLQEKNVLLLRSESA